MIASAHGAQRPHSPLELVLQVVVKPANMAAGIQT